MKTLLLCGLLWLLTGCATDNPLGMTTRTQIRSNAYVQAARVKAEQERMAREAEAQALVNAELARQDGLSQRNANWVMVTPVIVLAIGAVGALWMIIHWQGRLRLARLGTPRYVAGPSLPNNVQAALAARNCIAQYDGCDWWVVYRPTGQRLPQPITHLLEEKE